MEVNPLSLSSSSAKAALSNPVILREILMKVEDLKYLLKWRLVNKFWNDEITSLLLSNFYDNAVEIKFKWKENAGDFKTETGSLFQLIQLYRKSRKIQIGRFPCNSFSFEGRFCDNSNFQAFFSENGTSIRNLTLQSTKIHDEKTGQILRSVIFQQTPNVQTLKLVSWPRAWNWAISRTWSTEVTKLQSATKPNSKSRQLLQNLKFLNLDEFLPHQNLDPGKTCKSRNLVLEILKAAPNLECVRDPNLLFTQELISSGKFHGVKSLEWHPWIFQLQKAEFPILQFSKGNPQLTRISLEMETLVKNPSNSNPTADLKATLEFSSVLTSILKSSRKTLKTLDVCHRTMMSRFQLVEFSVLKNLKEINVVHLDEGDSHKWILPQIEISKIAPNLQTLTIELPYSNKDSNCNPLQSHWNSSPTVECLKLSRVLAENSPGWLKMAEISHPNLKELQLEIPWFGDLANILRRIWSNSQNFPHLQKLSLILTGIGSCECTCEIDSAITGIPIEKCGQLGRPCDWTKEVISMEKAAQLRTAPSICKMPKLAVMKVEMAIGTGTGSNRNNFGPLWSNVTTFYAFQPLALRREFDVFVNGINFTRACECEWDRFCSNSSQNFPSDICRTNTR